MSLRNAGLAVSMVTGNIDIPANNERAGMALRGIGPFLDLAQAFRCDLLRIGMKAHTDIPWARRACDEAAFRYDPDGPFFPGLLDWDSRSRSAVCSMTTAGSESRENAHTASARTTRSSR